MTKGSSVFLKNLCQSMLHNFKSTSEKRISFLWFCTNVLREFRPRVLLHVVRRRVRMIHVMVEVRIHHVQSVAMVTQPVRVRGRGHVADGFTIVSGEVALHDPPVGVPVTVEQEPTNRKWRNLRLNKHNNLAWFCASSTTARKLKPS